MAKQTKPRLGRGLSSLINTPVSVPAEPKHTPNIEGAKESGGAEVGLRELAIGEIVPSRFQPRDKPEEAALEPLAASIRSSGVIQPIAVRAAGEVAGARWELIAGERRWRAAKLAGLAAIPAIVVEADDRQASEWALIENVQREDLNPIERGEALRRIAEGFGVSHAELAERVGIERSSVTNLIRLTDLEPEIRDLIQRGALSAGHGKALLMLPAGDARVRIARAASLESWSVRRMEEGAKEAQRASRAGKNHSARGENTNPHRADLERQLSDNLGTKVRLRTDRSGQRGTILIEFYDGDHFEALLRSLGVSLEH